MPEEEIMVMDCARIERGRPPICFANGSLPPRGELPLINCATIQKIQLILNDVYRIVHELNGEDLPVAYATGSLPPRDELPLINCATIQKIQ